MCSNCIASKGQTQNGNLNTPGFYWGSLNQLNEGVYNLPGEKDQLAISGYSQIRVKMIPRAY